MTADRVRNWTQPKISELSPKQAKHRQQINRRSTLRREEKKRQLEERVKFTMRHLETALINGDILESGADLGRVEVVGKLTDGRVVHLIVIGDK
jgi:hypothetical protein